MREFIYDITDYRMSEGLSHDNWSTEEIQDLESFVRWYDDETLEFVVSNKKIHGIKEVEINY